MRFYRLIAIVMLAFVLTGCSYLFPPEEELLAPPLIEPAEVTYRTMEVSTGTIEQKLDVYANFSASLTASMAFEGQGGRVSEIAVKLGQTVKKGDLLIELNSETLRRQIRQQQIDVEKALLALEDAKRVEVKDKAEYDMTGIERAKVNLQMEQNALDLIKYEAEKAYRRNEPQDVQDDFRRQVEKQELVIKKAKLDVQSLEASYEQWLKDQNADKDAEDRAARIAQSELDLTKQQNVLNDLNGDLKNAQLFAPFDGVVTYVQPGMEVGQNVEGYSTIFRISDPTQVQLMYSGDSAHSFTVGMEVSITVRQLTFAGSVAADPRTIPTADGKMVSEVYFIIEDMTEAVSMGENAKITAILKHEEDVIVLPKNCINSFWGRKFVNLLQDGIKVEIDVETGIETATQVEIVKGLSVGDLVIMP